jgi:hypothetical protein
MVNRGLPDEMTDGGNDGKTEHDRGEKVQDKIVRHSVSFRCGNVSRRRRSIVA